MAARRVKARRTAHSGALPARGWGGCVVFSALLAVGCQSSSLPPPEDAVREYAEAVQAGDVDRLHSMLHRAARQRSPRAQVAEALQRNRALLVQRSKELSDPRATVAGEAWLQLPSGAMLRLVLDQGRFLVDAPGFLPTEPKTPEELVGELRLALREQDLPRLLSLLSKEQRSELDGLFGALRTALGEQGKYAVEVAGDQAIVSFASGLVLELHRDPEGAYRLKEIR